MGYHAQANSIHDTPARSQIPIHSKARGGRHLTQVLRCTLTTLRSLTDCQAISYTACGSTPQASYNTRARASQSAQRKTREPDDTFPLIPHTAGTVPLCHMYQYALRTYAHTHTRDMGKATSFTLSSREELPLRNGKCIGFDRRVSSKCVSPLLFRLCTFI
jgi:hypothetical protein